MQHAESLQDRTEGPLPTFLIIGVPKAGTTSLYHYCRQHPEVFMPSQKEPRFFAFGGRSVDAQDPVNQSVVTTIDAYRDLFAEDADAPACGEASPSCLATPKAAARIEEHVPDVKMIAILRDPVERAYSHFLFAVQKGFEPSDATFEDAVREPTVMVDGWERDRSYVRDGSYHRHLQ